MIYLGSNFGIPADDVRVLSNDTQSEYTLVWSDEFDGDYLDQTKWSYQEGTGTDYGLTGWGNNELQYYTARKENIYVKDGKLHLIAIEEDYESMNFTSARIRTINQGDWKYGKFEIRAKLPKGQGIWPAIWMLPTENFYGGWAASGEIDIMEMLGHEPNIIHGTIHYGGEWPNNTQTGSKYKLPSRNFSDDFHVFTLEWEKGELNWYVDNNHYQKINNWHTDSYAFPAPFDQKFHMLLNLAVGGDWPGNPDSTTEFPQKMVVDYVRVYQRN
ncbi:MAG: glycoside hydrolase family 16 protein [Balneolaceae bacterium]|nr:glycoside hydrolase family 16 protein [Balneolaceae bacterium]